jgi:DNA repair protein RecO (recombination protein O)
VNELLSRILEQETNYSVLFFDYLKYLQMPAKEEHLPETMRRAILNLHCSTTRDMD